MTSKLTITRARLEEIRDYDTCVTLEESAELARMALAGMDSEPVAWLLSGGGAKNVVCFDSGNAYADPLREVTPLYRHAQPAPELTATVERLNTSGYEYEGREVTPQNVAAVVDILLQQLDDAVQGRNAQPASVVMDDEKLRALFDAWFASDCSFDQSPEASEADNIAWRESYWYVWQRCRAAMLQAGDAVRDLSTPVDPQVAEYEQNVMQAGNSPVIPDGYVMVPKEPTESMINAWLSEVANWRGHVAGYKAMLAAAPQEVK
ncbi:TPA: hypothetical protein MC769_004964 [Klebsiella aerogenes]|nr:hypothetical protein [Klebsiella aerogenes]